VPIRSFRDGKSRLSPGLDAVAREALVRGMAERVTSALAATDEIAETLVVSADSEVLVWAGQMARPVTPVEQAKAAPGLDAAIDVGRATAKQHGADAVLSLFADLPFVTGKDIEALIASQGELILGTDRRRTGTNALLLRFSDRASEFRFAFGPESLERHLAESRRIGLVTQVREIPGIAFDLDTPGDNARSRRGEQRTGTSHHRRRGDARGAGWGRSRHAPRRCPVVVRSRAESR
jgi:2-phospho-L-lactate guanylyltransferase